MILFISLIVVSCLSGVLYNLGGRGDDYWEKHKQFPRWLFNTKVRDLGVPLLTLGWLLCHLSAPWWAYFLTFGIMFGTLTTYWDYWGTDDVEWYEWALTGFMYGLSLFILAIVTGHYAGFIYRCVILSVLTCLWSEGIGKAWLEESGRGFLIGITMPLMLIGG